jgi:hypothetical protein
MNGPFTVLDDIGSLIQNLPAERERRALILHTIADNVYFLVPGIIGAVESLLGGATEPTPTDDGVGTLLPPPTLAVGNDSAPSGPLATPAPAATNLGPASAIPFPSMSLYDPENPSGIPLPGTPFSVTAPSVASAAVTAPARRSRLNMRNDQMEKRIDISNIVNAVVSALPSGSKSLFIFLVPICQK